MSESAQLQASKSSSPTAKNDPAPLPKKGGSKTAITTRVIKKQIEGGKVLVYFARGYAQGIRADMHGYFAKAPNVKFTINPIDKDDLDHASAFIDAPPDFINEYTDVVIGPK